MHSRTWLFLSLSLMQTSACMANERDNNTADLSKSHPDCKLYGHFYAPSVIFAPTLKASGFGDRIRVYQKPVSFGFGQPPIRRIMRSTMFSDLQEVQNFVHGKGQTIRGIDFADF